ncbi:MAG: efflux RND transporter periplasmic adaptor subunit [Pacificimonas sp.]|jgi:RND family efflux transporter MFP subunit|nr:efflux RND transporter periplasmic adaptor subunit [Pacificimonas sp.]
MTQPGPFLAAMIIAASLTGCSGADEPAPEVPAKEAPPPLVQVAEAVSAAADTGQQAVGTVRLASEVALGFTTPGQIAMIAVQDGDMVRRGQLLAALDRDTVLADLSVARAERERARRDLARSQDLFADGWVTQARIDTVEAAASAADARIEAARFAVRTAQIVAPSDGVILERLAEPGQVVQPGTPVLALGRQDAGFVVTVPLTDRQAANLSIGDTATVRVDALSEAPVAARLAELAGRADPTTGTFAAEFALPAMPGLRSGQIGRVTLPSGGADSGVTVPTSAIISARADEGVVWVLDPGSDTVSMRTVSLAGLGEAGARITGGLAAGEQVVTANVVALSEGQEVRTP